MNPTKEQLREKLIANLPPVRVTDVICSRILVKDKVKFIQLCRRRKATVPAVLKAFFAECEKRDSVFWWRDDPEAKVEKKK